MRKPISTAASDVRNSGRRIGPVLAAAATTAALFYFFDSRSGARRRAVWRDKTSSALRKTWHFVEMAGVDFQHRAEGMRARAAVAVLPDGADAPTLEGRVRARLGRLSSHPRAIQAVAAENGVVHLRGDILQRELDTVLKGIGAVRGVKTVVNELRVHEEAGNLPFLQGEGHRTALGFFQRPWRPASRIAAGATGFALLAYGISRRRAASLLGAVGGAMLLARSAVNSPLSKELGLAQAGAGVQVQKTMRIYAEPDEVYAIWRDPQNFPRFMANVKAVRKLSDNVYHWKVSGPAGVSVEWNAEITADVPGHLLAWRTVPDAPIRSSGVVQFESDQLGGTVLHVRMFYYPPANALGHALAKIFGADPRRQMDRDLARFKSFIEASKAGRDRAAESAVVRH